MNKLSQEEAQALLERRLTEVELHNVELAGLYEVARKAEADCDAARQKSEVLSKAVNEAQAELDAFADKAVMVRRFRHHADHQIKVVIAKRTASAIFVRPLGSHGAKLIQFRLAKRGHEVWREYPEPPNWDRMAAELRPEEGGKL